MILKFEEWLAKQQHRKILLVNWLVCQACKTWMKNRRGAKLMSISAGQISSLAAPIRARLPSLMRHGKNFCWQSKLYLMLQIRILPADFYRH